jgi:quercetin dioxygenase-like cupin family protein
VRFLAPIVAGLRRVFGRRAGLALSAPVLHLGPVSTPAQLERVEGRMLELPQVDISLIHRFAPGVYMRTVVMPAGSVVIGHEHTTEHFNVVLGGRALVKFQGRVEMLAAGDVFVSSAGVRKVFEVLETLTFATIHPTEETNVEKLETQLVRKSETWTDHARLVAAKSPCLS